MQPLRGMGEKLKDIFKANARTQKLSGSSDSGLQRSNSDCAEEGNGKPLQYTYQENSMNRQSTTFQDMVLEDETLRSEGTEKMTGEEPRSSTISTVNNDVMESKPQGSSITEKYRYKRKDQSFLKTHKIGTWNVRSMNQGKLEIVKMEMDRIKIDILGIGELKWTGTGHFTSGNYEVYYSGSENIRKNGVALVFKQEAHQFGNRL